MRYSVSGNLGDRLESFSAWTAAEAAAHARRLRQLGVRQIHIDKDGRPITDAHEFERLLREDGEFLGSS